MSFLLSVLLWLSLFLCIPSSFAAPASASGISKRQNGSPVTVVTVSTIQGSSGPITETCTVTLTPITVDGQPDFQEVQSCTQAPASSNNNNSPPSTGTSDSSSTNTAVPTITDSTGSQSPSSTATSVEPTGSAVSSGDVSSTSVLVSGLASPTDVSVIGAGVSSLPANAQATGSVSLASDAPATSPSISSSAVVPTDVSVLGPSSMPAASLSAAAAAALASSSAAAAPSTSASAAAAFAIPGKQIQVLPIGLGVFAGVSVIALIVVGLVTYERTKYRKKFRKDKLAESAAPMGYGGMSERQ